MYLITKTFLATTLQVSVSYLTSPTLNVPHTKIFPSSVSAAVWESPALIWTTLSANSTFPGENGSVSSSTIGRPSAPSSLHPNV